MAMPHPQITSIHNPRIKQLALLRRREHRQGRGEFLIDGVREIRQALQGGVALRAAFVCPPLCREAETQALLSALEAAEVPITWVSEPVMQRLAYGERLEGVVATALVPERSLHHLALPAQPLVAVLVGVEKPGNVGAVIRTADAAGVSALVLADGVCDLYNPNTIRASLGTVFRLPAATASSAQTLQWLQAQGLHTYAARVDGELLYTQPDYTLPTALVLGSEAHGLPPAWTSPEVVSIRLPMRGAADSLNVAAAAAVLFYEALRQRMAASSAG
jgi:TrmH family RNA methyltransferase